jgi:hypothetical protein
LEYWNWGIGRTSIEKETEYGCGTLVVAKALQNTGIGAVSIPKLPKKIIFTKYRTATSHTSHCPSKKIPKGLDSRPR